MPSWPEGVVVVHDAAGFGIGSPVYGLGQTFQRQQALIVIRDLAQFITLGKSNLALLVYNKNGPVADSRQGFALTKDAIFSGDFAVWPEVAGQGVITADGLFLPCNMAVKGVHADPHHFSAVIGELMQIGFEP